MTTRLFRRTLAIAALAASLSACAAPGPRGPSDSVIARVLQDAPGEAQPSRVVKTELAFARAAREEGQLAAMREFATADAALHGRGGPVPFTALGDPADEPAAATEWGPNLVVLSCDGSLALSQGRFRDAEGLVGNYVTVWERQRDGSYRWSYDVAGRDDPQPAPRPEPQEGDIVVTAMDAVDGLVATCPRDGTSVPPPPPLARSNAAAQISSDGSLRWAWEHQADGLKRIVADYYHEGGWVRVVEEALASPDEG